MLDRKLQRQILEELRDHYPHPIAADRLTCCARDHFTANLYYLWDHCLVDGEEVLEQSRTLDLVHITAKGLDLLEGDGGIAAIPGSCVIRYDAETLRQLLDLMGKSLAPDQAQSRQISRALKDLTPEGLHQLSLQLMSLGIAQAGAQVLVPSPNEEQAFRA